MSNLKLARFLYFSGVFIIFFFVFVAVFSLLNYVHETGHFLFGFMDGVLKDDIPTFTISAWVNHPFFHFIKLPQQTKIVSGNPSLNFAIGGPAFTILIFLGLSLFAYLRSGKKLWFLLFFSILLFEVSGNIVCGTDNFTGNPLAICHHNLDLTLQYVSIALFSGTLSFFTAEKLSGYALRKIKYKELKVRDL